MLNVFASSAMPERVRRGPRQESVIHGAGVYVAELPTNLVRHGAFQQCRFYADGTQAAHSAEEALRTLFPEPSARARARVRLRSQVPEDLADDGWDVCWAGLAFGASLRSRYARRPFCIVRTPAGPIHDVVAWRMVPELLADLKPYDIVIYTSDDHRRALEEQYHGTADRIGSALGRRLRIPVRFAKLPCGVDTDTFRPFEKAEARKACGLPRDRFIILCVGRLVVSDKMDLLPVLRGLKGLPPDVAARTVLVLRGEQDHTNYGSILRDEIRRMGMQDRVLFSNDTPLALLYAAADVLIAPSDGATENFGLVPVEAMAAGTPVVVSDWNGYKDTVVHGVTGFRFRTVGARCDGPISRLWPIIDRSEASLYAAQSTALDIDEMFEYLLVLYRNPDLRLRMGRQARQHVLDRFAWPRIIRQFCAICEESVTEARKDRWEPRPRPATRGAGSRTLYRITEMGRNFESSGGVLFPGSPDCVQVEPHQALALLRCFLEPSSRGEALQRRPAGLDAERLSELVEEFVRQGILGVCRDP